MKRIGGSCKKILISKGPPTKVKRISICGELKTIFMWLFVSVSVYPFKSVAKSNLLSV